MNIKKHDLKNNPIKRPIFYIGKPSFSHLTKKDYAVLIADLECAIRSHYQASEETNKKPAA